MNWVAKDLRTPKYKIRVVKSKIEKEKEKDSLLKEDYEFLGFEIEEEELGGSDEYWETEE